MELEQQSFPETCLKGIPNLTPQFINSQGEVSPFLFRPHSEQEPNTNGFHESSINWEDDSNVEKFTLNMKKPNGTVMFFGGVARMIRGLLDSVITETVCRNLVYYERDPIDENKYHGNILMNLKGINKPHRAAIFEQLTSTIIKRISQQE